MLCLYGFHELLITSSMGQHPDLQCITTNLKHSTQTGWLEHGVHGDDYLVPCRPPKSSAMHLTMLVGRCHDEMRV